MRGICIFALQTRTQQNSTKQRFAAKLARDSVPIAKRTTAVRQRKANLCTEHRELILHASIAEGCRRCQTARNATPSFALDSNIKANSKDDLGNHLESLLYDKLALRARQLAHVEFLHSLLRLCWQ